MLYHASLAENSRECCSHFKYGLCLFWVIWGQFSLLYLRGAAAAVQQSHIVTAFWSHISIWQLSCVRSLSLWNNLTDQRSDASTSTLSVCMFFSVVIQRSEVSKMKAKEKQVVNLGLVCVFWGLALVKADFTAECELAAASLRGSPSESKHPMFDTPLLSSLRNVWTEKISDIFPKYSIVQSLVIVFKAWLWQGEGGWFGCLVNFKHARSTTMTIIRIASPAEDYLMFLFYFIVVKYQIHFLPWMDRLHLLTSGHLDLIQSFKH